MAVVSSLSIPKPPGLSQVTEVAARAQSVAARWLAAHSITALRISLGLVFLGFAALKFIPGASPAEALVMRTVDTLSFGMVTGTTAVVITAVVETFIGLTLVTGIGLRVGLVYSRRRDGRHRVAAGAVRR